MESLTMSESNDQIKIKDSSDNSVESNVGPSDLRIKRKKIQSNSILASRDISTFSETT